MKLIFSTMGKVSENKMSSNAFMESNLDEIVPQARCIFVESASPVLEKFGPELFTKEGVC